LPVLPEPPGLVGLLLPPPPQPASVNAAAAAVRQLWAQNARRVGSDGRTVRRVRFVTKTLQKVVAWAGAPRQCKNRASSSEAPVRAGRVPPFIGGVDARKHLRSA
jgi:hypothetical protein